METAVRHPRPTSTPAPAVVMPPVVGAVRVGASLLAGLLALAVVRGAALTLGRRPAGLLFLGRHGGRAAQRAGLVAAVLTAARARRRVPAYWAATAGVRPWRAALGAGRLSAYLDALPVLDKRGYIDAHPLERRCLDGRLPERGVEVDESSGSSGRPYQWVRSRQELDEVERSLAVQAALQLAPRRHRRVVVLNCFSMGAWATGQSVSGALRHLGVLKACGPDADTALAAIDLVGPDVCYVVCGYPPFLDTLVRTAADRGVDLSGLELWGFVGGEGMTEVLRTRLERTFHRVFSAYGASDLDIGVAGECELTVALRRAAAGNPAFAEALFGRAHRLPMVFCYDPSTYHVETVTGTDGDELVVTVTRRLLSPRVRYAVHDAGGTLEHEAVRRLAREHGVVLPTRDQPRLPLLFVSGRADSTVSHMGANLYPEDVDTALGLLATDEPGLGLGAFCLGLADTDDGATVPVVHVETTDPSAATADTVRAALAGWLVAHNRDWAAAAEEDRRALAFDVRPVPPGTGVFAANAGRIKRRYVTHTTDEES
ncbi:phenylacetate--CoA ligase family protein [Phycicoccus flavus]|uniref:Phenylacetate--CoA ligase family protein n=1 Tax=Phycicoccus flavus TaxID=2502783 RepID=A0A8T6RA42_9MICO|nr:phenylacetate--CoA ligase family protein [Phycicoccus flavus]NHA69071.1 phenylacetate--CoA ligase family protein [Phycicoccus flavus]